MIRARIIGAGAFLPDNVVTNSDLAKRVDTSDEWIRERTGIKQRYIAKDGQNTSDLALGAARAALTDAGIDADELDLIIVATTTPDRTFPSVATMVQARLGMSRGAAFDVQAVCSGFIYGLSLAEIAIPLAVFALGNVGGTILGGQLADRVRDRLMTFAVAMALSGVAALFLFIWHPGPATSVALGFVYVLLNALGRPSFMAALAAVPEEVRGTVLGLNGTSASLGWIGAAALGAAMISWGGFDGFGPLAAALALLGAIGALLSKRTAAA